MIHAFGLVISAIIIASPHAILDNPEFRSGSVPEILRAWGLTWLALAILGVAILLTSFRWGQRWAWYALWVVPVWYLALALLGSGAAGRNVATAVVAALGLLLTSRWFFAPSAS